jgi:methylthioxylose transferase
VTESQPATRSRAAVVGLASGLVLMAAAMAVPAVRGWDVHVRWFPPLHAVWDPRVGLGTLPALALGLLVARHGVVLAERLSWGRLLATSYAVGLGWMVSLALVDGPSGLGKVLDGPYEYLRTARATHDFPATLREYVSRIPYSAAPDNWPVHVAGHPPGALGIFVALDRVGLGGWLAAGLVVTALAASTAVAVLVTLRLLGAETHARRAAPFLVVGPAAIWQCVSADGLFAAVAAWGMAALAAAATAPSRGRRLGWSLVAGSLLGGCVMLSYGLPLLAVLAVAVLVAARSWRPLVPAALAATAVVGAFAASGFAWWEALPVLRERYWDGVASNRPAAYWLWGDLAALLFCTGPLAAAGVAQTLTQTLTRVRDAGRRTVTLLVGAAVVMVLAADASQMSRAEVERIWLPFVLWLLVSCALLPATWRRRGLVLQVVAALLVQHLLHPDW